MNMKNYNILLQILIFTILVGSLFIPDNSLKRSQVEVKQCQNRKTYSFRPFDLPKEEYSWIDCDSGLHLGSMEEYSAALDEYWKDFFQEL